MRNSQLLLVILWCFVAACSEKSSREQAESENAGERRGEETEKSREGQTRSEQDEDTDREGELVPETEDIGEDCVAFLRATRAFPPGREGTDCPECLNVDSAIEVLKFEDFKVERTRPVKDGCAVQVEIRALFNPSNSGKITGGLVGWISPAEREKYAQGETPAGSHTYKVNVTYTHFGRTWRAIEFAPAEK